MLIGNIYKLTSPSGKCYIGQTRHLNKRINSYKRHACPGQQKLLHALNKYGFENFNVEILFNFKSDNEERLIVLLDAMEKFYIKKHKSLELGYNLRPGGSSYKCTEETRAKFREIQKNRDPEISKKIALARTGSKHSDETKLKMSISHSNLSDETRLKLSKARIGRKHSEETIKKLSISKLNMSDETKRKIAAWHTGRKRDESTIIKLRNYSKLLMHPVVQFDIDFKYIETFESARAASAKTGIARQVIRNFCQNKRVILKKFR